MYPYLPIGILIGLLASIPLGPIGVLCVQKTLNKGHLSGFISGLGAAFSDTIYAIVARLSITFIISFIEKHKMLFQTFSSILLIIIGIVIFYTNPAKQLRKAQQRSNFLFKDFVYTFLLTISNPLMIFLFVGLYAIFGLTETVINYKVTIIFIIGIAIGAALWWLILTSVVNSFRKKIKLRGLWWINKIAGATIVVIVIISLIWSLASS